VVIRRSAVLWLEIPVVARAQNGQSRLRADADARLYQTLVSARNRRTCMGPLRLARPGAVW